MPSFPINNIFLFKVGSTLSLLQKAVSTEKGKNLNFFGGRYHNSFKKTNQDWLMSRSEYILDYNFTSEVSDLGDAMDQLQSGVGLNLEDKLYRRLYSKNS